MSNEREYPVVVIDLQTLNEFVNSEHYRTFLERKMEIEEGVKPLQKFRSRKAAINTSAAPQDVDDTRRMHTSIDYIYCLVPDLLQITNCSFYWGKIKRSEANKLLKNQLEGTFLLRDSGQKEYLFTVSFRKGSRSYHSRIEQWNHRFSFDSTDPFMFSSPTIIGLIEHYKDTTDRFFDPKLTIPLHRNFNFSLQHMCRATFCSNITYDNIKQLKLPRLIKSYLKKYRYKQRIKITYI